MPSNIVINKIQIIRPLLNYTKEEIIEFINFNKIKFIIDPSNYNEKYSRVSIRKFLSNTDEIKIIKKDFKIIKKYVPYYKLMINEILHKLLLSVKKNQIILSTNDFKKIDELIREKIIEKIYLYFQFKNKQLRYSKIRKLLSNLEEESVKSFNLSGMKVTKDRNFLIFLPNK